MEPSAVTASGLGSKMDAMKGDIKLVLQSHLGDKKEAAKEEKQEERQFAKELHKLGLAPATNDGRPKSNVKWPSQLELPGQGERNKAPYQDV